MSSSQPTALHYPLVDHLPENGSATEVLPGVYWIRMGLPFALDHINLWLLRDQAPDPQRPGQLREGWTIVDCGIDNPATREAWAQLEHSALQGLPVLRVLVTHMHPDHMGLAHWLCERWQAPLWIGLAEYQAAKLACLHTSGLTSAPALAFFAQHGWQSEADQATVQRHMNHYAEMVPRVPATLVRLQAGQRVRIGQRDWQCVRGLGHSPEHIALWCEDEAVFISGDMLLPSISSNISVYHQEPEADPLAWFLQSLEDMQVLLPEQALVLPSHGRPFRGAHTRIAQLQAHHAERLAELRSACAEQPRTALEVLPVLFRRTLNTQQMTFAMGEAVAHLNALWHRGELRRELDPQAGAYRFVAINS